MPLSEPQMKALHKITSEHGATPALVRLLARKWVVSESEITRSVGILEAAKVANARAFTESGSAAGPSTDLSGISAADLRNRRLAEELQAQVTRAESRPSLAQASLQELEAVAAAYG